MRRAKIVCTMGPAVDSSEKVHELIAGVMIGQAQMAKISAKIRLINYIHVTI